MPFHRITKSLKEYFSLRSAADDTSDFNYVVVPAAPKGLGPRLKAYFDLYSDYKAGDRLAGEIMQLANAEGVTKGRFDSSSMAEGAWAWTYTENNFSVKLKGGGRMLLKCDAVFAEKVGKLASAGTVTEIGKKPAAPKQPALKP